MIETNVLKRNGENVIKEGFLDFFCLAGAFSTQIHVIGSYGFLNILSNQINQSIPLYIFSEKSLNFKIQTRKF